MTAHATTAAQPNKNAEPLVPAITIDFDNLSEHTVKVITAHANAMNCTPNEAAQEILARVAASSAA